MLFHWIISLFGSLNFSEEHEDHGESNKIMFFIRNLVCLFIIIDDNAVYFAKAYLQFQ